MSENSLIIFVRRLTAEFKEVIVLNTLNSLELTTDVELVGGAEEILDTGVGIVIAAKDLNGLLGPVSDC